MGYPFPEIDHAVIYPRTFLKDVAVYVSFRNDSLLNDLREGISSYFTEEFNISENSNIEIDKIDSPKGLSIASSDSLVAFNFRSSCIAVKIKYPAYKSFGNLLALLPKVKGYLNIFDVSVLDNVRLVKYNELMFDCQDDSFPIKEIMSSIFSKHLMEEASDGNYDLSKLARWERCMDLEDGSSATEVEITYGYARNDMDARRGVLTLKTAVESMSPSNVDSLDETMLASNRLVDRAFHWCVTDEIINKMKGHE